MPFDANQREAAQGYDLLEVTLASIGDAVIASDPAGLITFMNPVAESITGWSKSEAAGKPVEEVFAIVEEGTFAPLPSPVRRALEEDRVVGVAKHALLLARDGRRITIDDSAAPIRDAKGERAGVVLVFRDVSERRRAEQALEASEARFRAAFAHAPIGMVVTDGEGRLLHSNAAYLRIAGYERENIGNMQFLSLTHVDEAPLNRELFQQLIAREIPSYVIEKRLLRGDGSYVWVRASGSLLETVEEGEDRVIGIVEDIDSRKRAEATLEARARLATFAAATGVALVQMRDLQHGLRQCTDAMVNHLDAAFARIWTLNAEQNVLELQASSGMYTHLDGPHARVPVGAFKIGLIAQERAPHLTNDVLTDPRVGDREWAIENNMVAFAGYPLIVDDRVVGVMAMFARKRLQPETLEALGTVANSVAVGIERKRMEEQRTVALEREQLARREAELIAQALGRANDSLQRFAYAASHDLRSPLRTVSTMTALLAKNHQDQLDERASELMEHITAGVRRMDSLISDLLSFAGSAPSSIPVEEVPLNLAVEAAVQNLQSAIEESKAGISVDPLPTVKGQHTHLLQVFQNLIANSIKYRATRPLTIHVWAQRHDSQWVVNVRDNGQGFDPKYASEVFGAFKRLHGGEYAGSGIGLATCKRIVEGFGGRIWVTPEVDKGCTFSFSLPAK